MADEDLRAAIRSAALRKEPRLDFRTVVGMGWGGSSDEELLGLAAGQQLIVVSHDVNTMVRTAALRLSRGLPMAGLLLVRQASPIRPVVDDLILIWGASVAEEWVGRTEYLPV